MAKNKDGMSDGGVMEAIRIYISQPADRDAVVAILARNGYTVRQGRVKDGKAYRYFVEYWRDADGG